jgi:RsiW-degrading membrane proteinase PrsW (M82 family)
LSDDSRTTGRRFSLSPQWDLSLRGLARYCRLVTQVLPSAPPGWYADPHNGAQLRWWSGTEWTAHVAGMPAELQYQAQTLHEYAQPYAVERARPKRPGVIGGLLIFVSVFALWVYSACAELFWLRQHGTRIVIVTLASAPTAAALLYVMCRRLRPMDKITPQFLLLVAILGGFTALIIPALIEPAWERVSIDILHAPLLPALLAGPLEEACKLAVVVVVARWVTVRNARTGLFIGGAVGFGYSIFENIDWALNAAGSGVGLSPSGHFGFMIHEVIVREATGAFGHPIWTALAAAALFAAARGGRLRISRSVVLAFAGVTIAHVLWDAIPTVIAGSLGGSAGAAVAIDFGWTLAMSASAFFVWRAVSIRANRSANADAAHAELAEDRLSSV